MLSSPKYGWTKFSLGSFEVDLSYLTDVCLEWIETCTYGLKNRYPFTVHGFTEPWRLLVTVSYYSVSIIYENDERIPEELRDEKDSYFEIHSMTMLDFCKNVYSDINDNFEAWVYWDESSLHRNDGEDQAENEAEFNKCVKEREIEIRQGLNELKIKIDLNETKFGDHSSFF